MKVALLGDQIDNNIRQGQMSYAYNLIKGLQKLGVDMTLLYGDIPSKSNYPFLKKASYRIFHLPFINSTIKDILLNIAASRYDILHVLTNSGLPYGRSKAKKIVTIHDVIIFRHPEYYTEYTLSYLIKDIRKSVKYADAIITISEHSKKDICDVFGCEADKIHVTHLGIDRNIFYKQKGSRFIPDNYILYVGGPHRRKGLSYLLEAFGLIKKSVKHNLVLVDNVGSKYEEYKNDIIRHGLTDRIIIKPCASVKELVNYYSFAEVLIYPSLYEGFGLPPLEAMACECPVISSNNSALKEVYEGVAMLTEPKEIISLANTILKVISDNKIKNTMIEKGLALSMKMSLERLAQTTLETYKKILSPK